MRGANLTSINRPTPASLRAPDDRLREQERGFGGWAPAAAASKCPAWAPGRGSAPTAGGPPEAMLRWRRPVALRASPGAERGRRRPLRAWRPSAHSGCRRSWLFPPLRSAAWPGRRGAGSLRRAAGPRGAAPARRESRPGWTESRRSSRSAAPLPGVPGFRAGWQPDRAPRRREPRLAPSRMERRSRKGSSSASLAAASARSRHSAALTLGRSCSAIPSRASAFGAGRPSAAAFSPSRWIAARTEGIPPRTTCSAMGRCSGGRDSSRALRWALPGLSRRAFGRTGPPGEVPGPPVGATAPGMPAPRPPPEPPPE